MDVSFISITHIFSSLNKFFQEGTKLMALIKPQFEVKKDMIEKGGIVRNKDYHIYAIERVLESAKENGIYLEFLDVSPIKGGKGNTEYISLFGKQEKDYNIDIEEIVNGSTN